MLDFAGGTNFILVALLTLGLSSNGASPDARQILASIFLALWAFRLSGFLLFRILKTGTDTRFDDKRDKFLPFLGFWVFQMFWVWLVSLPVTILNSPNVSLKYPHPSFGKGADVVGIILWVAGFAMESISDLQKYRFKANVQSTDKDAVCSTGLFAWSRHPNYFGEMLVQFGIYALTVTPSAHKYVPSGTGAYAAQFASVVGPVFLTILLMFVSGLTLQERPGAKKRYDKAGPEGSAWLRYKAWLDNTSILIPFPPALYRRLPLVVKRTILLEFPLYVFDPKKHAGDSKHQDEESRGEGHTGEASRESGDQSHEASER